jgi:hypothetical protein
MFARCEGIVPAPEANHAVRAAMDEALKCKQEGKSDGLRERTAFGVMRLLRAPVFRRCALAGSPPALDRRLIASPKAQDRALFDRH